MVSENFILRAGSPYTRCYNEHKEVYMCALKKSCCGNVCCEKDWDDTVFLAVVLTILVIVAVVAVLCYCAYRKKRRQETQLEADDKQRQTTPLVKPRLEMNEAVDEETKVTVDPPEAEVIQRTANLESMASTHSFGKIKMFIQLAIGKIWKKEKEYRDTM